MSDQVGSFQRLMQDVIEARNHAGRMASLAKEADARLKLCEQLLRDSMESAGVRILENGDRSIRVAVSTRRDWKIVDESDLVSALTEIGIAPPMKVDRTELKKLAKELHRELPGLEPTTTVYLRWVYK